MSGRDYSVILGKDEETGEPTPIKVTEEGAIKADLGVAPVVGPAFGTEDGLPVKQIGPVEAITTPAPGTTAASAAEAEGREGIVVHLGSAVNQGAAGTDRWAMSDTTTQANTLATKGAVEAVEDAVDELEEDADATRTATESLLARERAERVTGHGEQRVAARKLITSFRPGNVENLDLYGFLGTGTHQIHATTRSQEIAVSGVSGQTETWQSHTKFPLPPMTPYAAFGVVAFSDAGQANQVREIALGDETEFVGLRLDGTDAYIVLKSAITGVAVPIPRASWLDPLDGTGPSGVTIDWTNFNTFEASGGVPGVMSGHASINEIRVLEIPAPANALTVLRHTEAPFRATITNNAVSSPGHIRIKGFGLFALGDYEPRVLPAPAPPTVVARSVGVGGLPVLSIRTKTNLPMAGGPPWRGLLLPRIADISANGGQVRWELIKNPASLTGAAWASAGDALGMEYDVSATAVTIGPGQVIANGTLATSIDSSRIDLAPIFKAFVHALRVRVDGIPDVLTLFVAATIGSATVRASFTVDVVG